MSRKWRMIDLQGIWNYHQLNKEKQAGLPANKHTQTLLLIFRQMFAITLRSIHNPGKRFSLDHCAAYLNLT
jgi:hypothetical protein